MSLFSKEELEELLQEADEEAKLRGLTKAKAKKYTRKKFLEWIDDFTIGLKDQIKVTNILDPNLKEDRTSKAFEDFHYFRNTYFPHYYTLAGKSGLQEHLESVFKRIKTKSISRATVAALGERFAIAAPRGFGKSTDVSVVFAIYCIVYDLKHFITLFSDAIELTETLIEAIKAELEENERLKADFPKACGIGKIWKVGELVTRNNIKVKGFGSGKRVRGIKHGTYRVDLALIDDLENDTNVKSRKQRDKLEDWLDEAIENLGSVDGSMDIIYIGTILHRDSVLSRKLKLKYWNPKTFRALITYPLNMDMWEEYTNLYKHESVEAATNYYRINKAKMHEGVELLWDSVSLEFLMRKRASNPRAFEKEQQNNPNSENQKFNSSKFIKISLTQMPKLDRKFLIVDAKGDSDTGDYCGFIGGGICNADLKLYVFYSKMLRIKGLPVVTETLRLIKLYKPDLISGDANGGFYMLRDWLKSAAFQAGIPMPIAKFINHTQNKEDRMGELEFPIDDGDIIFVGEHFDLFNQMDDFPEADYDDLHDPLQTLYKVSKLQKIKKGTDAPRTNVRGSSKRFSRKRGRR